MKGSLVFVLLLLVGLIGLSAAAPIASPDFLVLIPNGDMSLMNSLAKARRDVRGFFGDFVFLFESRKNLFSLVDEFPRVILIGLDDTQRISIVEGDSTTPEWTAMMKEISGYPNYRVLFQHNGLIVVGDSAEKQVREFVQTFTLPFDAEYSSLPEVTIVPVPVAAEANIRAMRKNLVTRKSINDLVSAVNEGDLRYFAEYLSGEGSGSPLTSRQSMSTGAVSAGEWAISVFTGYGFNASADRWTTSYCPNIIAERKGAVTPDNIVIIGAHLDDRNAVLNDATGRAPGANDDGSGSAAILQIAKAIADVGAVFEDTIRLALWCGEEQGLVGSRNYAARSVSRGENVVGMFQADMIGYQAYTSPQAAFVNRYTNTGLTDFTKEIGALYVPEIQQVETSACCSDHQSFYELGVPSVGIVEGGGYTIDPRYHHVQDLVNRDGYSLNQMQSITRILIAAGAELARIL